MPRRPLLFSVAAHALLLTALFTAPALAPEPMQFETFQIEIVSAPPEVLAEEEVLAAPEEEVEIETPDPEPPAEEPTPPPVEEAPPEREPEREPPQPEPKPATRPEEPKPTTTTPPEEARTEAGADMNVRLEGLRRDYPAYYANIIRRIRDCFRPPRGDFTAVVYFVIRGNGTVSERRLVERSGNPTFDYAALGAIECAGDGRFGPLPDDLPYERLPVQFTFEPRGLGGANQDPFDPRPDHRP
jgi:outer membrane biosynthesis protein TonB